MEFKLNKIDTELRMKVNDASKEEKIHSKREISIGRNENDSRNKSGEHKQKKEGGKDQKKADHGSRGYDKAGVYDESRKSPVKIPSDNVNACNGRIEVEAFLDDDKKAEITSGVFLDVRK